MKGLDYFAELYVAGILAKEGWNVYFPHRDEGFDFITSKLVNGRVVLRPVQVKGKYPLAEKTNKGSYGYVGRLTQLHEDMVLAIPYFDANDRATPPRFVAFMPRPAIKKHKRGYRFEPAVFRDGKANRKIKYERFFDDDGIKLLESDDWKKLQIPS